MLTTQIIVKNKLGLHARPSAKVSEIANQFQSEITISTQAKSINAKSIMHIMMLAANQGTVLTIAASGEDESDAIAAIEQLFENQFNEK